jgi:hypothetical protein
LVATAALAVTASSALAELAPPQAYSNNVKINTTPVSIVANGSINLSSTILGKISCQNTFYAQGWNENNHGYGEVLGWGTSGCTAPEEIKSLEAARKSEIESGKIPVPLTVFASAEMPLEKTLREASVCKNEKENSLSECPNASERENKNVVSKDARRVTSLPWKVELIRGEREEEPGILEKIGLEKFGESGTAAAHTTKCYVKEKFGKSERPAKFESIPAGCVGVDIIFPQIPLEFVFYGTQEVLAINGSGNGLDTTRLEFNEAGTLFTSEGLEGEGSTTGLVKIAGASAVQLLTAK